MLGGEGLTDKKAILHVQHTFLYISLPLFCTTTTWNFQKLLSYTFFGGNVVRVLIHFVFTDAHFHLALVTASISHFVTATKFSCCSSNKKCLCRDVFSEETLRKRPLSLSILSCRLREVWLYLIDSSAALFREDRWTLVQNNCVSNRLRKCTTGDESPQSTLQLFLFSVFKCRFNSAFKNVLNSFSF